MDEFEHDIIQFIFSLNSKDLQKMTNLKFCNDLLNKLATLFPYKGKVIFKGVTYTINTTTKRIIAKYYVRIAQIVSAIIRALQPRINDIPWEDYEYTPNSTMNLDTNFIHCIKKIHSLVDDDIEHLFMDTFQENTYGMSEHSRYIYNHIMEPKPLEHPIHNYFQEYMKSLRELKYKIDEQQIVLLSILSVFQQSTIVFTIEELEAVVVFTKKSIDQLNKIKNNYYSKSLQKFEVFMEAQKLSQLISRIQNLEQSYKTFF